MTAALIEVSKYDLSTMRLPLCPHNNQHVLLTVRLKSKRTGAFVNVYMCRSCKKLFEQADWHEERP